MRADTKWFVPISYTTAGETNGFDNTAPKAWLLPDDAGLDIEFKSAEKDWIILNIQESAYYRVNYDEQLWGKLVAALEKENFNGIHELNRAQIVDDLFALTRGGERKYTETLKWTDFLRKDTSYYPWYSAFTAFNWLLRKVGTESELGQAMTVSKMILEIF